MRAFIEKFKTWPDLYKDKAILIGITKDRITKESHPEFKQLDQFTEDQFKNFCQEFQLLR